MKNTMEYKGYVGSVEFSEEDGIFFGKVMGIRSLISYEGTDARSLVEDFHGAVDDELNQIGIKIDMYRQEYRFTPAFAFIQAV